MCEKKPDKKPEKKFEKKLIQVPVVVGIGEDQFFVEKEIRISPPCPPVYMVKEIKKWVDVYDVKVICGKILFNAFLWKDINYKTVDKVCPCDPSVCGPVFHYTTKIGFGGFVEVCGDAKPGDKAELLEAKIEGERDDWKGECFKQGVKVYTKLIEKTVIKLKFKVVREKELLIDTYPEKKDFFKDDDKKDFFKDDFDKKESLRDDYDKKDKFDKKDDYDKYDDYGKKDKFDKKECFKYGYDEKDYYKDEYDKKDFFKDDFDKKDRFDKKDDYGYPDKY